MDVDTAAAALVRRGAPWQRGAADPDAARVLAAQVDPAAFVALYTLYVDRIHRYVRVRVRDEALSEDITSQVFTTALAHIDRFQGGAGSSFAAWLFRIAHNAVQDSYRGAKATDERAVDDALGALPDPDPGPEARLLASDQAAALRAAIAQLRPEQQHALALRYGADLSIADMARALGKSAPAVRVSLHRALRDLRGRYPHDE